MESEILMFKDSSQTNKDQEVERLQSLQERRAKLLHDYQAQKQSLLDELEKVDADINAKKRTLAEFQSWSS